MQSRVGLGIFNYLKAVNHQGIGGSFINLIDLDAGKVNSGVEMRKGRGGLSRTLLLTP